MSELLSIDVPPYENLDSIIFENLESIIEWGTYEFKPEDADMLDLEKKGLETVVKVGSLASVFAALMGEANPKSYKTIYRSVAFAFVIAELAAPQNFNIAIHKYCNDSESLTEKAYKLRQDAVNYLYLAPAVRGLLNCFAEDLYNSGSANEFDLVAVPCGVIFMLIEEGLHENYLEAAASNLK